MQNASTSQSFVVCNKVNSFKGWGQNHFCVKGSTKTLANCGSQRSTCILLSLSFAAFQIWGITLCRLVCCTSATHPDTRGCASLDWSAALKAQTWSCWSWRSEFSRWPLVCVFLYRGETLMADKGQTGQLVNRPLKNSSRLRNNLYVLTWLLTRYQKRTKDKKKQCKKQNTTLNN